MTTLLWILQILLALLFVIAGGNKVITPYDRLIEKLKDMRDFAPATVKAIGTLEVLGAIGLILPVATGILPWLTPLAAMGLVLTMIGAALTHLRHSDYGMIAFNMVILSIAAFIVYGLLVLEPVVG
jgi:uncharacterized membrane protein YphA (DoxX/SURF4 family)